MMRVTTFDVKQLGWPATGPEGEAHAPADAGLAIDGNRRTADCAIAGCRVHESSDEAIDSLLLRQRRNPRLGRIHRRVRDAACRQMSPKYTRCQQL